MFTVYTYFGRVLATFRIEDSETHHSAMESARKYLLQYERDNGKPAWIKLKSNNTNTTKGVIL